jgi:hypothetical protein
VPKPKKESDPSQPTQPQQQQQPPQNQDEKPPRGHLILKTFDPLSGATLKYKTSKAAEVTRLIQMLGTLGRRMAGASVLDEAEDEVMADVSTPMVEGEGGAVGSGVQTPTLGQGQATTSGGGGKEQAQQQQQQQGGKGKKKKGKR